MCDTTDCKFVRQFVRLKWVLNAHFMLHDYHIVFIGFKKSSRQNKMCNLHVDEWNNDAGKIVKTTA